MSSKLFRVSVKALIADSAGRYLLVQERGTHWSIPGGSLEHSEDILDALRREIQEELGVGIANISERPRFVWTKQYKDTETHCLVIAYDVTPASTEWQLANDIRTAQFFSPEEMQSLELDSAEEPLKRLL